MYSSNGDQQLPGRQRKELSSSHTPIRKCICALMAVLEEERDSLFVPLPWSSHSDDSSLISSRGIFLQPVHASQDQLF